MEHDWKWRTKILLGKVYTYVEHKDNDIICIKEDPYVGYFENRFIKLENITELEKIFYGVE